MISKALSERLKNVLPDIISENQTAYINNRFISEGGRLINGLLEVCDTFNKKGYLVTIDIEKAFDSVNHVFLIAILEKFGFGKIFIEWIKILLKDQESCVINGGKTSQYFKLERGTRQGDPISAYLFIIVLEVIFLNITQNNYIKGIKIFEKEFLYTAYADDTTFFLQNKNSVKILLETFHAFSLFSGLKPNKSKCEIAGIGLLKGVNVALCGMECVDLKKDTIKILGIHYSYNQALENDQNFTDHIIKIENALKLWRSRSLNLEGKITVFKCLALSKIIHLALVKPIPNTTIEELTKIQNNFIWSNSKPKIKNLTFSSSYQDGGLKNVNIKAKIISLQCSWIKRLFDNNTHNWKIIPLGFINKYLGNDFKFHSNLQIDSKYVKTFPKYFKEIITAWSRNLACKPDIPSAILSQFLWYNNLICIGNSAIHFRCFSKKGINFVSHLFNPNGQLKPWDNIRFECNLDEKFKFKWIQLIHAIPKLWKDSLAFDNGNSNNLFIQDHHLLKKHQISCLAKLNSKEIYLLQIILEYKKPTSQVYFENLFENNDFDWNKIYILPRLATVDSILRSFQYKVLHNVLYLNQKLFLFRIAPSPLCSFCNTEEETVVHIFYSCVFAKNLWNDLKKSLESVLHLPDLTPQSSIFGFFDIDPSVYLITNHLLLIFKFHVYNARSIKKVNIDILKRKIKKVQETEKNISQTNENKYAKYKKKWKFLEQH